MTGGSVGSGIASSGMPPSKFLFIYIGENRTIFQKLRYPAYTYIVPIKLGTYLLVHPKNTYFTEFPNLE
jgi:hypothetical protein